MKTVRVPSYFPSWHPQQLIFPFPNPRHSQSESRTNNLHLKKNLDRIGLPYEKLLNFGRNSQIFPLCDVQPLIPGANLKSRKNLQPSDMCPG